MKTWLLTWNPKKWDWENAEYGLHDVINEIDQLGFSYYRWSVGTNKSIQPGDRLFLIRLGAEPRGIVASGNAVSCVYNSAHWDNDKRAAGVPARRVLIKWDKVLDSSKQRILDYSSLKQIAPDFCWSSQSSGISIPDNIANVLEGLWDKC